MAQSKKMTCSVRGCRRPVIAKGLCSPHWQRHRKWGDVQANMPVNARNGSFNRNWKGGEHVRPDGRVLVFSPDHPNAGVAGVYVLRSRLIMEDKLGRFLTDDEIIHHKNGNASDDRIENLELLKQSQHAKIHNFTRKRSLNGRFTA